jgi:ureidoglycolate lyase
MGDGNTMAKSRIPVESLTRDAFQMFGDVIEAEDRNSLITNQGTARRYNDLAAVDVTQDGGRPLISLYRVEPTPLPAVLRLMERHPIASQAFIPLASARFLVVVAPAHEQPTPGNMRAFLTNGQQGVNYRRGTWHHPMLAIDAVTDFLVVDRGDEGGNYDEVMLGDRHVVLDYA